MLSLDRDWTRPAPTHLQLRNDAALAVVAAVTLVFSVELWRSAFGATMGSHGVEAYAWFAVAGLALGGRRRLPLATLMVESAIFIVIGERLGQLGATFTIQVTLFATLYAAWAWSNRPRALVSVSVLVVLAMFTWLIISLLKPGALPAGPGGLISAGSAAFVYGLAINVAYFGGGMAWGHVAWRSARQRAQIEEQNARERERLAAEQQRAVADERVRIARDLHDVVAHHISGIGVQAAGAGRVLDVDPAATRVALGTIEESSRAAVTQMHQLVGLLRAAEDGSGRAPQPGLSDLATLSTVGGRPTVEHRQVGVPFPVPETVGVSLFRIAQEAVTNVRRHASARTASVVVRYVDGHDADHRAVEVEVLDDGRGHASYDPQGGDSGFGLTGIRERAAMHGGVADIGPRPHGGFRVRVRIPMSTP